MHPEIRQSTPGNCPICGMTLEPIIPVVDQQEEKELTDFNRSVSSFLYEVKILKV